MVITNKLNRNEMWVKVVSYIGIAALVGLFIWAADAPLLPSCFYRDSGFRLQYEAFKSDMSKARYDDSVIAHNIIYGE